MSDIFDPPQCAECKHLYSVHPCKGSGGWTYDSEPLIWVDEHTALLILRHCLCEVFV